MMRCTFSPFCCGRQMPNLYRFAPCRRIAVATNFAQTPRVRFTDHKPMER